MIRCRRFWLRGLPVMVGVLLAPYVLPYLGLRGFGIVSVVPSDRYDGHAISVARDWGSVCHFAGLYFPLLYAEVDLRDHWCGMAGAYGKSAEELQEDVRKAVAEGRRPETDLLTDEDF